MKQASSVLSSLQTLPIHWDESAGTECNVASNAGERPNRKKRIHTRTSGFEPKAHQLWTNLENGNVSAIIR
jgi:hypothetical protein